MKKLLIMTGVAAFAFGAFATITLPNGTGFDDENTTFPPDAYWGIPQAEWQGVVTSWSEEATPSCSRPEFFSGKQQANYFSLESAPASDALVRYIGTEPNKDYQPIGNGLYLDTLVKFTAVSTDSTETMGTSEAAAKLAIWAQTSETTPTETNFVIQAGYVTSNNVTSTNYVMTAPTNNFDYTAWHRLTVKAIGDIGGGYVGFVVFVDGTALTRANSAAIGDDGYVPELNTVASQFADAVLPSIIHTGVYKTTLQAVSFSGTGGIDDISFTDVAPKFAADATVYTVTWGEGISGVSCGGTAIVKDAKNTLPPESFDLVVTLEDDYALGKPEASGCTVTANGNTFTVSDATAGASIEFKAFKPKASVEVGGKTSYCASLSEAFVTAIEAGGTITLSGAAVLDDALSMPSDAAVAVTIDLCGQTITGAEGSAVFTIEKGLLIVTNSVAAVGAVTAGTGGQVLVMGGGLTKIYGGKFTGGFEVDGAELTKSLELYGGLYDEYTWGTKEDLKEVAKADVSESENGYFTVGGETPPESTTYKVTFVDYDGTEIASGDVEEGVKPTAPAENPTRTGYTFTGWDPTIEAVTSNTTYTAKYSINTYTVTFDVDGDTTVIPAQNVNYGNTATEPEAPTKDNYTFAGWTLAGQTYDFAEQVKDNITLVATWTANPIDPAKGGTAEFADETAAAAAASAINDSKSTYITAPEGIDNTYYDNVEAKVYGNTVSVVFTDDGKTAAQKSADTEVDELDKALSAAAAGATEASITGAVPGFFYSVVYGTALTGKGAFAAEGDRAQADKDGNVTIPVPCAGEGAGFYKVKVSPTK